MLLPRGTHLRVHRGICKFSRCHQSSAGDTMEVSVQTGLHVGRGLPPVHRGWIAHGSEPVSTSQCDCESMLKTKKQFQGHAAMLSGEAATEAIGATDQRSGIPGNSWTSGARKGTQRGRTHKPAHCPTSCKVDSPQPGPSPAWGGGTGQEGEVPGASRDSSCIIFTSPHPFCRWEIESRSCSESGFKPRSVGFLLPSREGWTGRSSEECILGTSPPPNSLGLRP